MKKMLVLALILVSVEASALNVKGFIEGNLSTVTLKDSDSSEKIKQEPSLGLVLEMEEKVSKKVRIGLGVKINQDFKVSSKTFGKIDFAKAVPIYITTKAGEKSYIKVEAGYNFPIEGDYIKKVRENIGDNISLDGGTYIGLAAGTEIKNTVFEIGINQTQFNFKNNKGDKFEYMNNQVSTRIGYKF